MSQRKDAQSGIGTSFRLVKQTAITVKFVSTQKNVLLQREWGFHPYKLFVSFNREIFYKRINFPFVFKKPFYTQNCERIGQDNIY